ncbi:MAG TPA: hypothetical protein VN578_16610 [Candidatus Binatia bacterium]|jgi:hypothetical protein|nr:hypothetical protein [Candidatus Binatia bacterium]
MPEPENQTPPSQDQSAPKPATAVAGNPWAYPVMWMVIVVALVGGGVYVFKSCRDLPGEALEKTGRLAEKVGQQLQNVAAAFNQGTVTTTFTSYATTLKGSQHFQFATVSQTEVFTRKDESSTAFGYVPLPDVIVEATAPVTYTYYLDLNQRWDFRLENGVIDVVAPDIKYNKPSVDVSRITYEVKKDSLLRKTREAMDNLKESITWMTYKKAEANIGLVRETGRKETETFVQNWLARSFADGTNYPVKVRFRSETKSDGAGNVQPEAGGRDKVK